MGVVSHDRYFPGEKPYSCPHCDRQFGKGANLRRHVRVHTGERPYKCDLCPSDFADLKQLKAHKTKQHQDQGENSSQQISPEADFAAEKTKVLDETNGKDSAARIPKINYDIIDEVTTEDGERLCQNQPKELGEKPFVWTESDIDNFLNFSDSDE